MNESTLNELYKALLGVVLIVINKVYNQRKKNFNILSCDIFDNKFLEIE